MERKKMKKKGFTLVELLVVIAIIAMLLAILMPALAKVRTLAQRIMCGTNIGGIGKAMLTYGTDDEYESYPIAGGPGAQWDFGTGGEEGQCTWVWCNPRATPGTPTAEDTTLSACLYLLVKYADVSPDQYICPGASDQKKFEMANYKLTGLNCSEARGFTDLWDFGDKDDHQVTGGRGRGHNSYSYQLPLPLNGAPTTQVAYPIMVTSNPASAIIADRNPLWDSYLMTDSQVERLEWDTSVTPQRVKPDSIAKANCASHQRDGQNVLFADQHVRFEKSPNCGVEMDNIYTSWGGAIVKTTWTDRPTELQEKQCGNSSAFGDGTAPCTSPQTTKPIASSSVDSYLVSDYQ